MTAEYRTEMRPLGDGDAGGLAGELMDGARAKLGFVPNMYRGMANDPGLLSTYIHGYQHVREGGTFTPREQETVFLTISRANGCDYCMAAHSMLAVNVSGLTEEETQALRAGRQPEDESLAALSEFTHHMWQTRGLPTEAAVKDFKAAGYGDAHVLGIILAMAVKTISNYTNHVVQPEIDEAFAQHAAPTAA